MARVTFPITGAVLRGATGLGHQGEYVGVSEPWGAWVRFDIDGRARGRGGGDIRRRACADSAVLFGREPAQGLMGALGVRADSKQSNLSAKAGSPPASTLIGTPPPAEAATTLSPAAML
jgi:hypothetical protein